MNDKLGLTVEQREIYQKLIETSGEGFAIAYLSGALGLSLVESQSLIKASEAANQSENELQRGERAARKR